MTNKIFFAAILTILIFSGAFAQDKNDYKVIKTFHIASPGRMGLYCGT